MSLNRWKEEFKNHPIHETIKWLEGSLPTNTKEVAQ